MIEEDVRRGYKRVSGILAAIVVALFVWQRATAADHFPGAGHKTETVPDIRLFQQMSAVTDKNMTANLVRRPTGDSTVSDPYLVGKENVRAHTSTTVSEEASLIAPSVPVRALQEPATVISPDVRNATGSGPVCDTTISGGCQLTASSGGSGTCGNQTLPVACSTSSKCGTVATGCTQSGVQCQTVAPQCTTFQSGGTCQTAVSAGCTSASICANKTYAPACGTNYGGQYPVCIYTSANNACDPFTVSAGMCSTSTSYCSLLTVNPKTSGCTASPGNCSLTMTQGGTCSDTYSFQCMTTQTSGDCTQAGGCISTYAQTCYTSSLVGPCCPPAQGDALHVGASTAFAVLAALGIFALVGVPNTEQSEQEEV